jgi:hypothetical protein
LTATLPAGHLNFAAPAPDRVFTVREIAAEWKLSIDTIQRLFANEPDVFVITSGRKRTLRIPEQVKERVWRRMTNKRVN